MGTGDGLGAERAAASTPASDELAEPLDVIDIFDVLGDIGRDARWCASSIPKVPAPEKLAGRDTGSAVRGTNMMPRPDVLRITVGWVRPRVMRRTGDEEGNATPTSTSTLPLREYAE
jgi:hypothetical protein